MLVRRRRKKARPNKGVKPGGILDSRLRGNDVLRISPIAMIKEIIRRLQAPEANAVSSKTLTGG
jgi:hypothetical protein